MEVCTKSLRAVCRPTAARAKARGNPKGRQSTVRTIVAVADKPKDTGRRDAMLGLTGLLAAVTLSERAEAIDSAALAERYKQTKAGSKAKTAPKPVGGVKSSTPTATPKPAPKATVPRSTPTVSAGGSSSTSQLGIGAAALALIAAFKIATDKKDSGTPARAKARVAAKPVKKAVQKPVKKVVAKARPRTPPRPAVKRVTATKTIRMRPTIQKKRR